MARVKLTEHKAKSLILGPSYEGKSFRAGEKLPKPRGDASRNTYVAKVDQGVKKRFKQGLVAVNVKASALSKYFKAWEKKGFTQYIVEPFFPHEASEEQYFSVERVREGLRVLHAKEGGVDIEAYPEKVAQHVLKSREDCVRVALETGIPETFLTNLYDTFENNFFCFLEINPLIVRPDRAGGTNVHLLDAAALVDSTAEFFVKGAWGTEDTVRTKAVHPVEKAVEALAATTPAALSVKILNPNGALFFLLSGGGGSIVIADEAALRGAGPFIGNYGEYSGGPTREETYLYAQQILALMLASKAKKKALVIAGGIANFTDIKQTFAGIIDALGESASLMRKGGIKVFVRRGGPNEAAGLEAMKTFLEKELLLGAVYGSDTIITKAVEDAVEAIK